MLSRSWWPLVGTFWEVPTRAEDAEHRVSDTTAMFTCPFSCTDITVFSVTAKCCVTGTSSFSALLASAAGRQPRNCITERRCCDQSRTDFGVMPYPSVLYKYMVYIKRRKRKKDNFFLPNLNLKLSCGSRFPLIEKESLLMLERRLDAACASD